MIKLNQILPQPLRYLLLLGVLPLPLIYVLFHFFFELKNLEFLEEEIDRIHKKSVHFQEWQKKETAFLASLQRPDRFYIDKNLETLTFLEPEIKKLETLLSDNAQNELLKKRLHYLTSGPNKLLFAEEEIRQMPPYREIEEKQKAPVEMNEEDLKRCLSLIEGVTIWPYGPKEDRPQLIIKDFQLQKKELPSQENVYLINMQLLKRESLNDKDSP